MVWHITCSSTMLGRARTMYQPFRKVYTIESHSGDNRGPANQPAVLLSAGRRHKGRDGMSKRGKSKKRQPAGEAKRRDIDNQKTSSSGGSKPVSRPDWPQLVIAVIGLVVTGVLIAGASSGNALPYCSSGSGCDIVQQSAWSRFLGVPLAIWGFALYFGLGLAASSTLGSARVRRFWTTQLATSGFLISFLPW